MTERELHDLAQKEARACRSPDRDGQCVFLQPGSGVPHEYCPMHPHKCGRVTAKMWYEALRDALQLYGTLKED